MTTTHTRVNRIKTAITSTFRLKMDKVWFAPVFGMFGSRVGIGVTVMVGEGCSVGAAVGASVGRLGGKVGVKKIVGIVGADGFGAVKKGTKATLPKVGSIFLS